MWHTYCMNPPAKKEGNSRQRRLGCPLRVASIRHRNKDVVCSVCYRESEKRRGGTYCCTHYCMHVILDDCKQKWANGSLVVELENNDLVHDCV